MRALPLAATLLVLLLAGCALPGRSTGGCSFPDTFRDERVVHVKLQGERFDPPTITAAPHAYIQFENHDAGNATYQMMPDASPIGTAPFGPCAVGYLTFSAGNHTVRDKTRPNMTAQVVVG